MSPPMSQNLPDFYRQKGTLFINECLKFRKTNCVMRMKCYYTYLVTKNAGSFTSSGPTRMCPCSINFTAILIDSDILLRTITTGSRLLQKLDAVTLSHNERSHLVGIKPIKNLENRKADTIKNLILKLK